MTVEKQILGIMLALALTTISTIVHATSDIFLIKDVPECDISTSNGYFYSFDKEKSINCVIKKANQHKYECHYNNSIYSCIKHATIVEPYQFSYSYGEIVTIESYHEAFKSFKKACDLGNAFGCYKTGKYLLEGDGVRADEDAGTALLERACNKSSKQACLRLGQHYFAQSYGVNPISEKYYQSKAVKFYGKACDLGVDEGCRYYKAYK